MGNSDVHNHHRDYNGISSCRISIAMGDGEGYPGRLIDEVRGTCQIADTPVVKEALDMCNEYVNEDFLVHRPRRQRGTDQCDDDGRHPSGINLVTMRMADGQHLLELRGGGPVEATVGHEEKRPPLGAGVLAWLYDSDFEGEETAELERRRNESLIRDAGEWGGSMEQGNYDRDCSRVTAAPPMFVTGTSNGRTVAVCQVCYHDTPIEELGDGRACCGRRVCPRCAQFACVWCSTDPPATPTIISIASGLGLERAANAPEPERTLDASPSAHTVCMDNAGGATEPITYGGGDVPVFVHKDDTQAAAGIRPCSNCGATLGTLHESWRICRCNAVYCTTCAAGPCVDCPAVHVYIDLDADRQTTNAPPAPTFDVTRIYDATPLRLSPEEASNRRQRMMQEQAEARQRDKARHRQERDQQVRVGTRPKREKPARERVKFGSANVTAESTWRQEHTSGRILRNISYLCVQEHGQCGDERTDATRKWIHALGGDAVVNSAYIKHTSAGGGTAIVSHADGGLRNLSKSEEDAAGTSYKGRVSIGIGNVGYDFTCVSLYGIAGAAAAQQLGLWKDVARAIKRLGLPFVIGGDWQVPPSAVAASGLPQLLDGVICAPSEATNAVTGTTIDFSLSLSRWPLRDGK